VPPGRAARASSLSRTRSCGARCKSYAYLPGDATIYLGGREAPVTAESQTRAVRVAFAGSVVIDHPALLRGRDPRFAAWTRPSVDYRPVTCLGPTSPRRSSSSIDGPFDEPVDPVDLISLGGRFGVGHSALLLWMMRCDRRCRGSTRCGRSHRPRHGASSIRWRATHSSRCSPWFLNMVPKVVQPPSIQSARLVGTGSA
jgi:hypothetical protein